MCFKNIIFLRDEEDRRNRVSSSTIGLGSFGLVFFWQFNVEVVVHPKISPVQLQPLKFVRQNNLV
jgi:hypothetical protein